MARIAVSLRDLVADRLRGRLELFSQLLRRAARPDLVHQALPELQRIRFVGFGHRRPLSPRKGVSVYEDGATPGRDLKIGVNSGTLTACAQTDYLYRQSGLHRMATLITSLTDDIRVAFRVSGAVAALIAAPKPTPSLRGAAPPRGAARHHDSPFDVVALRRPQPWRAAPTMGG